MAKLYTLPGKTYYFRQKIFDRAVHYPQNIFDSQWKKIFDITIYDRKFSTLNLAVEIFLAVIRKHSKKNLKIFHGVFREMENFRQPKEDFGCLVFGHVWHSINLLRFVTLDYLLRCYPWLLLSFSAAKKLKLESWTQSKIFHAQKWSFHPARKRGCAPFFFRILR